MGPKYHIGESKLHGKGVIASDNIKKNEVIGLPLTIKHYVIINITEDLGKWLNHSWNANAKLVKKPDALAWDLVATQPINKGGEITMDYRETPWFIAKPSIWYR